MTIAEAILEHHGVKGMHWGVRRSETQLAKATTVAPTKTPGSSSSDAKRANRLSSRAQTHGTGNLSNKEMQDLVSRMNLEQQYSRLSSQSQTKSKGAAFAKNMLKELGPVAVVGGLSAMAKKSNRPEAVAAAATLGTVLRAAKKASNNN